MKPDFEKMALEFIWEERHHKDPALRGPITSLARHAYAEGLRRAITTCGMLYALSPLDKRTLNEVAKRLREEARQAEEDK